MVFGSGSLFDVGRRVFVLLPINRCVDDPIWSFTGVLRKSSRARYGSDLSSMAFLECSLWFGQLFPLYNLILDNMDCLFCG